MVLAPDPADDPAELLARYLRILAEHPRDLTALIGAGRAALDVADPDAAVSFYARAEEIAPHDGRIKAGLGTAMVQLAQPRPALRLFEEAVQYGIPVADIASDRGLAYALRGDSKRARADFELALAARPDPETTRRLALTQAIDGDAAGAMATLDPLLRRQDKAAWRARVFALAITGDTASAQKTAAAMLPKLQADALAPFLERIGKLRPSQQAAAVHFGQFPADGHKYSEAELFAAAGAAPPLAIARPEQRRPATSSGDSMADDQGDRVEDNDDRRSQHSHASSVEVVPTPVKPGAAAAEPVLTAKRPDVWAATQTTSFSLESAHGTRSDPTGSRAHATPGSVGSDVATAKPRPAEMILPKTKPIAPPAKQVAAERNADTKPSTGKINAKDETAKKEKVSKKPLSDAKSKQSERQWVQVATGAYKPDLGKAWDNLKKKYPALLARRSAWTTPLNRTNRLLIGPFRTGDEAQTFVNKAAGSGFVTSRFTSSAGQTVEPIS